MTTIIRLEKNGITILELTGKIIGEAIPELRAIMIRQIDASETPRFLINFKGVHGKKWTVRVSAHSSVCIIWHG